MSAGNFITGLCEAQDAEYQAFARRFEYGTVLYVFATCSWPVGPYNIFFEGSVDDLRLMQQAPTFFYNLITYHEAAWTPGQPLSDTPTEITVTDARGAHTVAVQPWGAPTPAASS